MTRGNFTIEINEKWCKACGICIALCPEGYLVEGKMGIAKINESNACIGCKSCVLHCPDFCLELKEV